MTFGFDSAVACATDALDRLHTTAESHHRVMVLEVMGRYAGWIALYAGVAGGADVILLPEIPVHLRQHLAKIAERENGRQALHPGDRGRSAREKGRRVRTAADQPANREARLGGIAGVVAAEIEKRTGRMPRVRAGHLQRGGSPTNFDRAFCSDLRRRGRGTDRRRAVRADGGLPGLRSGLGDDYRSSWEVEDGAAARRLCPHGAGIGNCFGD